MLRQHGAVRVTNGVSWAVFSMEMSKNLVVGCVLANVDRDTTMRAFREVYNAMVEAYLNFDLKEAQGTKPVSKRWGACGRDALTPEYHKVVSAARNEHRELPHAWGCFKIELQSKTRQ